MSEVCGCRTEECACGSEVCGCRCVGVEVCMYMLVSVKSVSRCKEAVEYCEYKVFGVMWTVGMVCEFES